MKGWKVQIAGVLLVRTAEQGRIQYWIPVREALIKTVTSVHGRVVRKVFDITVMGF